MCSKLCMESILSPRLTSLLEKCEIDRVLITGGAGFVGSHIARIFDEIGIKVKVLDKFARKGNSIGIKSNLSNLKGIEIIEGSVLDRNLLNKSLEDIDSVIHLASISDIPYSIKAPFDVFKANCTGTITMLEQCRLFKTIKCIILISSEQVYSMPPNYVPIDENHPLNASTPYGISKLYQDLTFQTYYKHFDLPTIVLRSGLLFGERQQNKGITSFIKNALEDRPITIEGGMQTRDIYYIGNLIYAVLLSLLSKGAIGQVFNISGKYERSIEHVVKEIIEYTGSKSSVYYAPYRKNESSSTRILLDISKAQKVLEYNPIISFKVGLELTVRWLKENPDWYKRKDIHKIWR